MARPHGRVRFVRGLRSGGRVACRYAPTGGSMASRGSAQGDTTVRVFCGEVPTPEICGRYMSSALGGGTT